MADVEVDGFLADSVVTAEGKLYVQGGGWNRLTASLFPATHDRIAIGLLVTIEAGSPRAARRFELRLHGPDGNEVVLGQGPEGPVQRLAGEFTAGADEEQVIPIAINLNGITFPRPGAHLFVLSIDGEDRKELPFVVQSAAAIQGPPMTGTAGYL